MEQKDINTLRATQREFLQDATTTHEFDPESESFIGYNYTLAYGSESKAKKVAKLACTRYNRHEDEDADWLETRTIAPRECKPLVIKNGNMYHATMAFDE